MTIDERLDRIKELLQLPVQQKIVKDWYTTAEIAEILPRAEWTVREWCRLLPAELDKGNRGRALPIAPEFPEFLLATQEAERRGPAFQLKRRRARYAGEIRLLHVSATICRIGKK